MVQILTALLLIQQPYPKTVAVVTAQSGELRITSTEDEAKYQVKLGDWLVLKTDRDDPASEAWRVGLHSFHADVDFAGTEVAILNEFTGGNACEATYRVLIIRHDKSFLLSESLGDCFPPTITAGPNSFAIRFPAAQSRHSKQTVPGEAYTVKADGLRELKSSGPKSRRAQ